MDERQETVELLARAVNHMRQQSQKIIELSQAVEALNASLSELLPGFQTVYASRYADVKQRLEDQGFAVPLQLFDQLAARLRNIG